MTSRGSGSFSPLTEATYTVVVQKRSTGAEVGGCRFTQGNGGFTRVLDGISSGEVTVPASGCSCDCIPDGRNHELAFYRDDCPDEPAWVGPIVRIVDDAAAGTIRIQAYDRLYWVEGAPASRDILYGAPNEIDIVELFAEFLEDAALYEDPNIDYWYRGSPGNLPPLGDLLLESNVEQYGSIYSGMIGLAKSSLDFTMVGPHLYWGSPSVPIAKGPPLNSSHWSTPPIIDRDFGSVTSRVIVTAAGGVLGIYPPLSEREEPSQRGDGNRTVFIADTNLNTQAEANSKARDVYLQNSGPTDFIITGDGSLSDKFPHDLKGLIPGRLYPVTADGQCLQADADELQLFNVVVEIGDGSAESKNNNLFERRVAGDFAKPGSEGSAERQSA
jgi:hypothetical protein